MTIYEDIIVKLLSKVTLDNIINRYIANSFIKFGGII